MSSNVMILNLRPLNGGGNGDIAIGQRNDNGGYVVVKYLREFKSPDARKRFLREVRVLLRKYRGVVQLLWWDTNGERPYYLMPYLAGGSLTTYAGTLSNSQLEAVANDLALTLFDIHAKGDAHGDFKPDNILVCDKGHLQVADPLGNGVNCSVIFGQNHGGTPGYWAPEIAAGNPISSEGDVYSYGATLYHLLTGRRPVDGQQLDVSGYVNAPKIREIIRVCCQSNPGARAKIQDVFRMLRGEKWVDIQAERQKSETLLTGLCAVGGLLLLFGFLAE
jgi:serine/threonine protein kinase